MKYQKQYLLIKASVAVFLLAASLLLQSCISTISKEKSENGAAIAISENDFRTVPDSVKPWVYYWWLKGNVTKEQITRDLEEMKAKGIGGFLLFDSRGYWDSYDGKTGHIPVPLNIKHEFMSPEWREMVKYTMQEANRVGLKMSMNIANTGGSLRGPWDMKDDGPKQLIWTASTVTGPSKVSVALKIPSDQNYFQDVAFLAVNMKSKGNMAANSTNLSEGWQTVKTPSKDAPLAGEIIDLKDKISNGSLQWDVPEGDWRIIRFAYRVIGEVGGVDILNSEAVTKYFHLMGSEILKDAGPLAGVTLTHFYNVSWEGGQPDWSVGFANDFKKFRSYDIQKFMPVLAGMSLGNQKTDQRFIRDYLTTVSDCFKHNCYETIGELCHAKGILWHSEDGGPWPREAPMFKEADQLTFWGRNDMPQGEFWCSDSADLQTKSNVRYAAMAGHIYGRPLVAVEAFTHMGLHWTKYPAYLKPFADVNLIDGANFFIWHTFTASPVEVGKPGYEYFAGTHINTNVTWWNEAGGIFDYLGRCQYLLQKGDFVADICCYVSDKNYREWGRGEKWNENSELSPVEGFKYDLLSSEVLVNSLSTEDGRLVLPGGMSYRMLVVDLEEPTIPPAVLKKIDHLVKNGATIVLGAVKPVADPGVANYPESDSEINKMADELWSKTSEQMQVRKMGKGKIYSGSSLKEILNHNQIEPDFEGPYEYIHRTGSNVDIYFISGQGKAECSFRVKGKKPELWNPVTGEVSDALCYKKSNNERTSLEINLPENGSVFVVFRNESNPDHFESISGPERPEISMDKDGKSQLVFWESGDYKLKKSTKKTQNIAVALPSSIEIKGKWKLKFVPATDAKAFDTEFDELSFWNKNTDPAIKYFSGTAEYTNSFVLDSQQAKSPSRLQLGKVHDISHVWVNDVDLGIVWTAPWSVDISRALRQGENTLKIEVTNCWANRLIGDAGLPESKWMAKTNVRRVPDRSIYKAGHQAFSALDELMPSGLLGPVKIVFGQRKAIIAEK